MKTTNSISVDGDDLAQRLRRFTEPGVARILMITHAWGGGIEQHLTTLKSLIGERARVMTLRPANHNSNSRIELELPDGSRMVVAADRWNSLLYALRSLDLSRVHLHHINGLPRQILDLDRELGLPLDVTLHDYMILCPQYQCVDADGRYCGEPDTMGCNACIAARPHAWGLGIEAWRSAFAAVLTRAERVIAPSRSVVDRIRRYFPSVNVTCLPHPERPIVSPRVVKVALLGALSNSKGLSAALAVHAYAKQREMPLVMRLIGHAAEPLPESFTATGLFESDALPALIAAERPDVIWLPSQAPETYCFTLSAALASGLPIVASDVGALSERLQGISHATLLSSRSTPEQWAAALLAAAGGLSRAKSSQSPFDDGHAQNYVAQYLRVLPSTRVNVADATALMALEQDAMAGPPATASLDRPLINVFQIGVYGGHTPSTRLIERELETLPPGETHIVGRQQFQALDAQHQHVSGLYARVNDLFKQSQQTLSDAHLALADAEIRAAAARRHIADLEQSAAAFQALHETLRDELAALAVREQSVLAEKDALAAAHSELRATHSELRSKQSALEHTHTQLKVEHDALQASNQATNERAEMLYGLYVEEQRQLSKTQQDFRSLETERDELLQSTSWRLTRPLRAVTRRIRRARSIAATAFRLVPRAPALWRGGMARFRRNGWPGLRERLIAEFRPKPAKQLIALPTVVVSSDRMSDASVALRPLRIPSNQAAPLVSILIPVYGQHATTHSCLSSIAEHPPRLPFEIVVMDDCSPESARVALADVTGIRIIRNDTNLGFIGNVNAAAAHAHGQWLIVLNNDTMVRPNALNALLDTFEQHNNVGLVGAKLLNADGSVQEAGGIVWRDGSAWNWGRNEDREDPRFNFVRDADYCSGAALAIAKTLFDSLGGFDTHYSPAYYEDTDLAFRVRARGLRVLYQPAAEIFHLEGVTHGRDETSGLKAYQVSNGKKFFARWQQTLLTHRENASQPEQEAHRNSKSNILIVEACMITPNQDSGSIRLLNLLRILKREGHHVSFVADNLDGDPKYAAMLQGIGVEVLHGRFAGHVRKVLAERGPTLDSIVICRHYIASQYVDLVRRVAPQATLIFDTVDLHFVREEREAALHQSDAMAKAAAVTRELELGVIGASDVSIVVAHEEKQLLASLMPRSRIEILSNIHTEPPPTAPLAGRAGILFVGGFRHPPNVDAVRWYSEHVLPLLRDRLPDVTTTIVGSNMPEAVSQLAQVGLDIRGFVEDISPLLNRARVSIAPLRYGAGVKGKVNEAMNYGVPVVATSCAVEGMHLENEREVLVADDAQAFADAIVRVYNDQLLWNSLSRAGIENVRKHFSSDAALPVVRKLFNRTKQDKSS